MISRGRVSAFLRSFSVQGSWNYRSVLGSGFAFSLIPLLRRRDLSPEELEATLRRHLEPFNSHPYLVGIALGAVARMEEERQAPDMIRRFKEAIRGSLGSLGDSLVWGAWQPTTLLLGLVLAWAGAPPWVPVMVFLIVYNAGHVVLRWWSLQLGLERGSEVGPRLREVDLSHLAERVRSGGTLLLGIFSGALLGSYLMGASVGWLWGMVGISGFGLGYHFRGRAPRLSSLILVGVITFLTVLGQPVTDGRIEESVEVVNPLGFHARPAAEFVRLAGSFGCQISLEKDGVEVNGKSIMGVLMLAAEQGSTLVIRTDGDDAQEAITALADLIASGFQEMYDVEGL